MSLYITSIIGSAVTLPKEYAEENEDGDFELEYKISKYCTEKGYELTFDYDDDPLIRDSDRKYTLIFGKKGTLNIQGVYGGWLMKLEDFVNPKDFSNDKEKEKVKNSRDNFLAKLPEEYDWLKNLEWSDVTVYIKTFN